MGLINLDPYPLDYTTTTVTNTYYRINIHSNTTITKSDIDRFNISGYFTIYYNKDSYLAGKSSIGMHSVSIIVNLATLESTPIYTIMYNQLRLEIPNYQDDI